jgi:hypothetical protein
MVEGKSQLTSSGVHCPQLQFLLDVVLLNAMDNSCDALCRAASI